MVYEPVFDDHIPLRIKNIDTAASIMATMITNGIALSIGLSLGPPLVWWITSVRVAGAM